MVWCANEGVDPPSGAQLTHPKQPPVYTALPAAGQELFAEAYFLIFKTKNMISIIVKLSGLKTADLIQKSLLIEEKMNNHPAFANPQPPLAELSAAREALQSLSEASALGDRGRIAERKLQEDVLRKLLRRLAGYVASVARNEADVIQAGFELRRAPQALSGLSRPVHLEATRSNKEGEVLLKWATVKGGRQYLVEMCTSDPLHADTQWQILGYTTRARHTVTQLEAGKYYWFRVRALGSPGESPYSDVALIMAA